MSVSVIGVKLSFSRVIFCGQRVLKNAVFLFTVDYDQQGHLSHPFLANKIALPLLLYYRDPGPTKFTTQPICRPSPATLDQQ